MKFFVGGALLLLALLWGAWWSPTRPPVTPTVATSLAQAWSARSLTLRTDGCVELLTEKGQRAFVFEKKAWRECPQRKPR